MRDRAIVFVLLSTGLRREELTEVDLSQVEPSDPERLRSARRVRIRGVKGKGGIERNVFLSKDAREALAEYLERAKDASEDTESEALFLSAVGTPVRREGGRLSVRAVNLLLDRIGRWHDAETTDPARKVSLLRPHDLRHIFAYRLAAETNKDAYELERRLGHGLQRYTNRPATWKDSERGKNGRSGTAGLLLVTRTVSRPRVVGTYQTASHSGVVLSA